MAEEKTSTKKRIQRRKRTSTKQQTKSQGFSLRSEVKGLIVIAFAVISLLGFFGFELGLVGQIFNRYIPLWFWPRRYYSLPWCVLDWLAIIV